MCGPEKRTVVKTFRFRLSEEEDLLLKELASDDDRTENQFVRRLLAGRLKKKQLRKTTSDPLDRAA